MSQTAAENGALAPDSEATFSIDNGADPMHTMSLLWQGRSDPQMRFVGPDVVLRATRTSEGAAALRIRISASRREALATAWGPGAARALELVPGMVGALDDASLLVPQHVLVANLARQLPGLRLARGGSVFESLVVSILAQKVTGPEARGVHQALVRRYGEAAPGPLGLRLPPLPEKLAKLPYWSFHPQGIERRRADTIRQAAAVAPQLEAIRRLSHDEGERRLRSITGIGVWTAAETMRLALGDPDAVSVGDFHLPRLICWALAGESNGDDARMLELLEPYRGQRARVALLIERGLFGQQQRRAPRMPFRSIASI
ncbi:MAG: DNA-3-methyladenine glycosylase 2 family protein [Candidatus Limnocylindrales bacterium]